MDDFQAAQEQDRDFHRAECDLERLLEKVETGMAVVDDVKEIRSIVKMLGFNVNAVKPKETKSGDQNK